eukprot:757780-Hanusia_phi.AAC.1
MWELSRSERSIKEELMMSYMLRSLQASQWNVGCRSRQHAEAEETPCADGMRSASQKFAQCEHSPSLSSRGASWSSASSVGGARRKGQEVGYHPVAMARRALVSPACSVILHA